VQSGCQRVTLSSISTVVLRAVAFDTPHYRPPLMAPKLRRWCLTRQRPTMRATSWRPSSAIKKHRNHHAAFIDPSGLAGIMLFFLALFMVPISGGHGGRSVDLAATRHATLQPGALKEDALDVILTRDGRIYFGHTSVKFADLPEQIRLSIQRGSDRKVYLRADARVKYGDVKAVLDQVRAAGVQDVAVLVETARK
jgi:biopolymer transport protein TolR